MFQFGGGACAKGVVCRCARLRGALHWLSHYYGSLRGARLVWRHTGYLHAQGASVLLQSEGWRRGGGGQPE